MSSSPRLTYLITGTQYGGATVGMVRLLSNLPPAAYDVTVVTLTDSETDVTPMLPEHVTVRRLGLDKKTDLPRLAPLVGILRSTDVLVCSAFHATAVGVPLGRALGVPSILVWQHNTRPAGRIRASANRLLYRAADRLLADSESVASMVTEEYGVPPSKVSVLPIAGVDTDTFRPLDVAPLDGDVPVGTVGRLTPEKGYEDLFRCARRLGDRFQFHVAGDGPEREWMEADRPDNVTLHGAVPTDEIPAFLNGSDVYFQPSRREGLCMTVIEAMACGLPVVGSAVGGITESVEPGETGFLCEAGDVECFCRRLEALAEDPTRRREMGTAGRKRVRDRYTQAELVGRFRETVDEVH